MTAAGRIARGLFALAAVPVFAALVALGFWQLDRLQWKEALIAAATERPTMAAVPAPGPDAWADFRLDAWNYRRVALTGTFGPAEAHVWTALSRPRGAVGGPGYWVVAPFTTAEGWSVLVNRGFVPEARKAAESRPAPPEGVVTVEGLVRDDDTASWLTPEPDPARNIYFTRQIGVLAPQFGLTGTPVAPYTVDLVAEETPAGGLPQAGESLVTFSNNHLQYALTWFGTAAALAGVVLVALVRRRR